jgi:hypothetical protein
MGSDVLWYLFAKHCRRSGEKSHGVWKSGIELEKDEEREWIAGNHLTHKGSNKFENTAIKNWQAL